MANYGSVTKLEEWQLEEYEEKYIPEKIRNMFDISSCILSAAAGVISYFLFKEFNIFAAMIPAVILDFGMLATRLIWGQWLMNHDYKLDNDITYLTNYVSKLEEKKNDPKRVQMFNSHCKGCYNLEKNSDGTYYCYRRNRCNNYGPIWHDVDLYNDYAKKLKNKQEEMAVEAAKKSTKRSAEYDDKLQYFDTMILKIDDFAAHMKVKVSKKDEDVAPEPTPTNELKNSLRGIVKSLKVVKKILVEKPESLVVVSRNLYVYLDELQLILNKFSELSAEMQIQYIEDIQKVCVALNENIQHTIKRLRSFDTEKLEVSLDTLLKELVKENEEEKNND